ncbi:PAS domain-containing protein [Thiohalobacter thiocyanaticus]|nr:PAS domain-containing protein [Thiohalobacter thiocyanaticus]
MYTPTAEPNIYLQLRSEAETRLEAGTAAANSNWSLGADALHLLHRLSSNPQTAADALKLLHELQVHQVELDLQNEEMHANEQRLVEEVARYKELYEFAPLGHFLVNLQGEIIESNRAAAKLLGAGQDELTGDRIDRFLTTDSRSALLSLLKRVGEDGATLTCEVTIDGEANTSRPLRVVAKTSPDKRRALLICCEFT